MKLKSSQIGFIIDELSSRGLIYKPLREDIVDHICTLVEEKMEGGMRFSNAYKPALVLFGNDKVMEDIQRETLFHITSNSQLMLKNYLKIAVRNLNKHRFYSLINIVGLSIGLACCLLITLFVINELNYDTYHEKSDRIYRITNHIKFGGKDANYAVSPAPMAPAITDEIPEIETACRFRSWGSFLIRREDREDNFKEYRAIWSDPGIFDVFTIPLINGNASSGLTEPNTMMISRSLAEKYYPEENPLNKIMVLNNEMSYKITGVFRDMPDQSHFHFDVLLSMEGLIESRNQMWLSENFQTYVLFKPGSDLEEVERKLNELNVKYAGPQVVQFLGMNINEFEKTGSKVEIGLQPLKEIHLYSDLIGEFEANGDIKYVYIFSAIAVVILILALVNFINLSTARSAERAREVGIRKVLGSYRIYLIRQFLSESILLTFISVLCAMAIAGFILPYFNNLSGKSLAVPYSSPILWCCLIGGTLIIGTLAGIYPALILSAYRPITIIQGRTARGSRARITRNVLVIFQFTSAIILIIATLAVYNQLSFIQHKKLGFNKDQVIIMDDAFVLGNQMEAFKNEILRDPAIKQASISDFLPVPNSSRNSTSLWEKGSRTAENSVIMQFWRVDPDYIETLDLHLITGRAFSDDYPSDSGAIILNESAARQFGYADPVGRELQTFSSTKDNSINENNDLSYRIVGVVENFHFESMKENIGPLGMVLGKSRNKIIFKYDATNTSDVISLLRDKWNEMAPGQPFQYSFLNDEFGRMYDSERKTGKIFFTFAMLAILIACLGLFALAAFMAEQRTKEIGVRKVMGATRSNIVFMLSKDFGKLVMISLIVAIPISWYAITQWLESFAYKDVPGIDLYGIAGMTALLIAWLTVGYQSFKAASTNPATSLRDE